jgi:uncharacterized protein (DUF1330 family)
MPVEPDAQQLGAVTALAGGEADGPIVMLNLNRYRERAHYMSEPPRGAASDVSGHEAYMRYGAVASTVLERVGGRILWHTEAKWTVIGDETDRYDEVIAVWYPNLTSFAALATDPEILEARTHRTAGLDRAALICCRSAAEPVLTGA